VALIAAVIVGIVATLGTNIADAFTDINGKFQVAKHSMNVARDQRRAAGVEIEPRKPHRKFQ